MFSILVVANKSTTSITQKDNAFLKVHNFKNIRKVAKINAQNNGFATVN